MQIALDIDETIATGARARARSYCQQLGLPFDSHIAQDCTTPEDVLDLPVLVRFYHASAANKQRFAQVQERAHSRPELFQECAVMPGAREGVQFLAERATIRYCSVCLPELEQVTRDWLVQHDFPNATSVIFWHSSLHKLHWLSQQSGPLVLIDDRIEHIIRAYQQFQQENRAEAADLATRLTFIAFGAATLPTQDGLRVLALPSWHHIEEVFSWL